MKRIYERCYLNKGEWAVLVVVVDFEILRGGAVEGGPEDKGDRRCILLLLPYIVSGTQRNVG